MKWMLMQQNCIKLSNEALIVTGRVSKVNQKLWTDSFFLLFRSSAKFPIYSPSRIITHNYFFNYFTMITSTRASFFRSCRHITINLLIIIFIKFLRVQLPEEWISFTKILLTKSIKHNSLVLRLRMSSIRNSLLRISGGIPSVLSWWSLT
jgi:hypothetical protein